MSLMQWGLNWLTDMNWLKENERMSLKLVMQGKSEDELLAKIRAEGRKAPNICMSCASLQASHLTKFGGAMFFKEPFLFPSAILLHPAAAASLFFESVVETCSIPTLVISWTPYCYNFTPTNPTCLGVPIAHFQEHDLCSDGRPQRLKSRPSSFFDFPLLRWYGWLKNCWVLQKHSFCLDASTFFQSDAP